MSISSPLRYPGGKSKLFNYFVETIKLNNLFSSEYCEPYAGGAGLALMLLANGFVSRVSINDIDTSIYAFWKSILSEPQAFCKKIENTPVTIEEWKKQKEIWMTCDESDRLNLGFATYFLNRTNRSGIIDGAGPIGGFAQAGKWKIDVRFNKKKQISNIEMISNFKSQISVSNLDAKKFITKKIKNESSFLYLDPPYYVKGKKLYKNFYDHRDHVSIAKKLEKERKSKWVVSYDDVQEIRDIYSMFDPVSYGLNYSAGQKGVGKEVIFSSDSIVLPPTSNIKKAA